ncbi:MAG: PQQ-binding-like beta-propeller repeat protein [Phycisphaeraceae bacterium]|nr:PQQ-binding-like beta-propeller repeat protein [Phycisphaeraceae bacterium]
MIKTANLDGTCSGRPPRPMAMCAVATAMMIAAMTAWASDARADDSFSFSGGFIVPRFVEGALPGVADGRLRLELGGDTVLYLFVRDQKLGEAVWIWRDGRPQDSKNYRWFLRGEAGRIRGFLADSDREVRVDASVAPSGAADGTWRIAGDDAEGPITGTLETWDALADGVEPATGPQWPQWAGPTHDFRLPAEGLKLLEDYGQIRPLWRSEEASLNGIGSISRAVTGLRCARHHMAGGSASPVLADGRLYLSYFIPSGGPVESQMVDRAGYERQGIFPLWRTHPWGEQAIAYEKRRWAERADAVVVCIDPRNGRTLWRKVFPGVAANAQDHKGAGNNLTPAVADGRLYVVTTGQRMLCLDARDGSLIWEDQFAENRGYIFGSTRGDEAAPLVVAGVVVFGGQAWDARTGERLWRARMGGGRGAIPTPWHDGTRWLLLTYANADGGNPRQGRQPSPAALVAISLSDGETVWRGDLPDKFSPIGHGPGILGDEVAFLVHDVTVRTHTKHGGKIHVVYGRVSPDGFERKWISPLPNGGNNHDARPIITDQAVITSENSWVGTTKVEGHQAGLLAYNKRTGELLRRLSGASIGANGHALVVEDRLFLWGDNHHGHNDARIDIPLDIRKWPEQVEPTFIKPPHYTTSPYHGAAYVAPYANGRLFIRGADGIYAYDLRAP